MIRFVIDAQLPPGLALRFRELGYRAEHVNRVGLGAASDVVIWEHVRRIGAILITKDEDFAVLARHDTSGPQVVWLRVGNISNDGLWRTIGPVIEEIIGSLEAGERVVEVD
jgi:predicted nuclease of predicted toxin-antitoxin system